MSGRFVVNKSGENIPVYDPNESRMGTIYDGEAFIVYGEKLIKGKIGLAIKFLTSSGTLEIGIIPSTDEKYRHPMGEYPYGEADILGNGNKSEVFKMRRIENIYTGAGNYWGQVAAGSLVKVTPHLCGDTHDEWCQITYVQKSNGTWQKVDGDGYNYGYLDVGLNHGSFNSNISMYGSW